jgi:hypothetical protein
VATGTNGGAKVGSAARNAEMPEGTVKVAHAVRARSIQRRIQILIAVSEYESRPIATRGAKIPGVRNSTVVAEVPPVGVVLRFIETVVTSFY